MAVEKKKEADETITAKYRLIITRNWVAANQRIDELYAKEIPVRMWLNSYQCL
ncbi:hypothetical protein AMATHDRAFT_59547 [Amanita thiersii Skay4041]|uniref:Uncharacterized protein n=1 Tax=Amanita thiersii Skay4041 TaxID=703135 RepID=A0A2A9NUC2_9AGAR|nr:hypothetical protein AMATHDRAFT_59547 [Amanita thiersii Skay4041]